jgi:hypothetical protein
MRTNSPHPVTALDSPGRVPHLNRQLRGQHAEPGLDERIVPAALTHCQPLTPPAGPRAGKDTAYTLTLADQLPRRPTSGTRIATSRHGWARIASLRLQGITTVLRK